jgi:hypothetical protein
MEQNRDWHGDLQQLKAGKIIPEIDADAPIGISTEINQGR